MNLWKSSSFSPRKTVGRFLVVTVLTALHHATASAETETTAFADVLQPAFQESCVKCHGKEGKVKGKVNLFELKSADDLSANPDLLAELVEVLQFEEMPPEDEPPLDSETRAQLVTQLRSLLNAAVGSGKAFPPTPIRRMNRFQYNNAVQDLFALSPVVFTLPERMLREHGAYFQPASGVMPEELKAGSRPLGKSQLIENRLGGVAAFPQDLRAEHGFDNRGDHLSLSPLLLESFLTLSRSIVESDDFNEKTCGIWKDFFAPPPDAEDTAETVRHRLRSFLTRAFRRPVDDALLDRYTGHVIARLDSGESFTDGMKAAASAALASPRFLYLYDRAGSSEPSEPLDDFELASRLSFFLWGSIPDQELLDLAAEGRLRDPEVLNGQVDRMLNDRLLKRFCDSFPSQWLQLERIVSSSPNRDLFPEFYFHSQYRSSMHMMLEPLLLFETVLIEDRSILEFIDSDFSYRSEVLDTWYAEPGDAPAPKVAVTTLPFRRVALTDRREGGLITTAAVMTMTSNPTRTQPITRGAWIAGVIFNDPPEPPPADVPPLLEVVADAEKDLTLRERFEAHRSRVDCAGCHKLIDPLGFALENYGPTGRWRDHYENGRDVDAAGVLFRKHAFTNPVEFKDAILAEKDRFVRGFAAHLLAFALGREVGAADSPALDRILAETAAADYRFRPLLRQIVLSDPFLYKSNPAAGKKAEPFPTK